MSDDVFELTPERSNTFLGKWILVGVTRYNRRGQVTGMQQFAGTIEAVSNLLRIRLDDGDTLVTFPPMVRLAPPGAYRLRGSGKEIIDPALLADWDVLAPNRHRAAGEQRRHSILRRRGRRIARRARRAG